MPNENVSIQQADQFQPGKSAYECGFFGVEMCRSMNVVGQPPKLTPDQIIQNAEAAYSRYDGGNGADNQNGMTDQQLYNRLYEVGLHYQAVSPDRNTITSWLKAKYVVIVAVPETSVYDLELDDTVPYPWKPSGNHIIVLTGLNGSNYLARDSANIEAPNNLRPGPRTYDANDMEYVSATVVVPPGLPRPVSATPPKENKLIVPAGWKDDGTALTAPNGFVVVKGFRSFVLNYPNGWDTGDLPLENEHQQSVLEDGNTTLGAGAEQAFRKKVLEYLPSQNKVQEMWTGQEILALRKELAAARNGNASQVPVALVHSLLVSIVNFTQPAAQANQAASDLLKQLGV